jgi:predicted polyphosphate/ATP-dependent NAD kinase
MVTICRALEKTGWDVIVVAFPGGHGTASLVSIATDNQLLVRNVEDV